MKKYIAMLIDVPYDYDQKTDNVQVGMLTNQFKLGKFSIWAYFNTDLGAANYESKLISRHKVVHTIIECEQLEDDKFRIYGLRAKDDKNFHYFPFDVIIPSAISKLNDSVIQFFENKANESASVLHTDEEQPIASATTADDKPTSSIAERPATSMKKYLVGRINLRNLYMKDKSAELPKDKKGDIRFVVEKFKLGHFQLQEYRYSYDTEQEAKKHAGPTSSDGKSIIVEVEKISDTKIKIYRLIDMSSGKDYKFAPEIIVPLIAGGIYRESVRDFFATMSKEPAPVNCTEDKEQPIASASAEATASSSAEEQLTPRGRTTENMAPNPTSLASRFQNFFSREPTAYNPNPPTKVPLMNIPEGDSDEDEDENEKLKKT